MADQAEASTTATEPVGQSDEAAKEKAKPKPAWTVTAITTIAFLLGAGLSLLAGGNPNEVVAPGMVALFVAIAAHFSPRAYAIKASLVIGLLVFLVLVLALVTTGHVIAAGVTMGVLAFITAMGQAGGKTAAGVSAVIGTGYMIPAVLGVGWERDFETVLILGLTGLVAGLAVAVGVTLLKREEEHEKLVDPDGPEKTSPLKRLVAACRTPGPVRRYAIERAVLLGGGMAIYQATELHSVFWVLLTMFIVLAPDPAATWQKAVQRASGVIVGALAVGLLGQVLPGEALVGLGVVALLIGAAYMAVDYRIWAAGISFLIIAIFGTLNQSGLSLLDWAGLRVLDTVIGVAIALVGAYLIKPRKDTKEPSPGTG